MSTKRALRLGVAFSACVWAIVISSVYSALGGVFEFTAAGASGTQVGRQFLLGAGGHAFLQDAFLAVPGLDLNGASPGIAGSFAQGQLPLGMTVAFQSEVQPGAETVTLVYTLSNTGPATHADVRFVYYLDCEIGEHTNTFFNECAAVHGTLGAGPNDAAPDSFSVAESGYAKTAGAQTGSLELLRDRPDAQNRVPRLAADDVALALSFELGDFRPEDTAVVRVLVSAEGVGTEGFHIVHEDLDPAESTRIVVSGAADKSPAWRRLDVAVTGPGTVSATGGWYAAGTTLAIAAAPDAAGRFVEWSGDVPAEQTPNADITLSMDRDRAIVARFEALTLADLGVTLACDRPAVKPGDRFALGVSLENAGPDGAGAAAVALNGAGVRRLSASATCGYADAAGNNWVLEALPSGGHAALHVRALALPPFAGAVTASMPVAAGRLALGASADGRLTVGQPDAEVGGVRCGQALVRHGDGTFQTVPAPDPRPDGCFGFAVASIGGGMTAVAAFPDGTNAAGRIHLLDADALPAGDLAAPAGCEERRFGYALTGAGNGVLCVGAPAAAGGAESGAVYLVETNATVRAALDPAPQAGNRFGETLAFDGHRLAVGASGQDANAKMAAGVVYLYNTGLTVRVAIENISPDAGADFGAGLCLVADGVAVGAPGADYAGFDDCGMVYVCDGDGRVRAVVSHPDPRSGARFGSRLAALDGGRFAVAAGAAAPDDPDGRVWIYDATGALLTSVPGLGETGGAPLIASGGDGSLWVEQSSGGLRALERFGLAPQGLAVLTFTAGVRGLDNAWQDPQAANDSACIDLVVDAEAPRFDAADEIVLAADDEGRALFAGPPPAVTDNYDPAPVCGGEPALPCLFAGVGTNWVNYWAADVVGNTGRFAQAVCVVDVTPPLMETPAPIELTLGTNGTCVFTGPPPVARDNCDPNPVVTSVPELPVVYAATGLYEVVYSARDFSGNAAGVTQIVNVVTLVPSDVTPPTIWSSVPPGDRYVGSVAPIVTAEDAESGVASLTLTLDGAPFQSGDTVAVPGAHALAAVATDGAGNVASTNIAFGVYAATQLTLADAAAEYSDALCLRARLLAGDTAVAGVTVGFTVNGAPAGTAMTDANGYAELTHVGDLAPGVHLLGAVFRRDDARFLWNAEATAAATIRTERAALEYVGDTMIETGGCWAAALVTQEADGYPGDLARAAVRFGFDRLLADDTQTNVYSGTAWCDSDGVAALDLNVGPGLYRVAVATAPESWFLAPEIEAMLVSLGGGSGKVTGGGAVNVDDPQHGTPGRANFGFNAQTDGARSKGHLEYRCKDADIDLKGDTIRWLLIDGPCAQFEGTGTLKKRSGTYTFQVFCIDVDEPGGGRYGASDRFTIRIWAGAEAAGTPIYEVRDQPLTSGNIQVH
ncbi:MAG: post-COAP-1 domain-containing protein [Kiritimatiellae bacterium]|nr:post-COAP-1 domain-containing protein [Kiritimatiellia bacterium]